MDQYIKLITPVILGISGIIATVYYSRCAKYRENDKLLKELYTEFNKRYDKLNNNLSSIVKPVDEENKMENLSITDKGIIIDFFNLCAEEYFWYQKGRIDNKIWKSWKAGMNYWYNHKNPIIRKLWDEETNDYSGLLSYYIVKKDEFFKLKNK